MVVYETQVEMNDSESVLSKLVDRYEITLVASAVRLRSGIGISLVFVHPQAYPLLALTNKIHQNVAD